jgi:hypothetical protein
MIDRESVIVTRDPISHLSPAVGRMRLLKHCFACFGKHHSRVTPMRESMKAESIIVEKPVFNSRQTATLRQDLLTRWSVRSNAAQSFTHASGM